MIIRMPQTLSQALTEERHRRAMINARRCLSEPARQFDRLPVGVFKRGTPHNPTAELVHLWCEGGYVVRLGHHKSDAPACLNGAYHLVATMDKSKVTCPKCLEDVTEFARLIGRIKQESEAELKT